jgi:hypothetical protein
LLHAADTKAFKIARHATQVRAILNPTRGGINPSAGGTFEGDRNVRRRVGIIVLAAALVAFALAGLTAGEIATVPAAGIELAQASGAQGQCTRRLADSTEIIMVPCNQRLAGDWGGILTEDDGDTYRVEISLTESGKGSIAYPKLNCSGTLEYKMRRAETYIYTETITEGTKCGDTAEVELTAVSADGSTFDYNWIGVGPKVTGRLSGVMTAGVTAADGSSSRPGANDEDECFRYLPNREALVPMPCRSNNTATD